MLNLPPDSGSRTCTGPTAHTNILHVWPAPGSLQLGYNRLRRIDGEDTVSSTTQTGAKELTDAHNQQPLHIGYMSTIIALRSEPDASISSEDFRRATPHIGRTEINALFSSGTPSFQQQKNSNTRQGRRVACCPNLIRVHVFRLNTPPIIPCVHS